MSKILLLEDDDSLAMAIEFNLEEEGFLVDRVSSVVDAKNKFNKEYDLILLDVMLPDGSGYDVCKYIRKESEVPIIFLTACDDEVNVILGLEIGADDYITKPFRAKELITRIKVNMRRWKKDSNFKGILKSGYLEINVKIGEGTLKNNTISLSSQEYKLLLIFLNNPNIVLSKEQILDKLYEFDSSLIDDKTLAVYIRRLREKIEEDSTSPRYIITKRGIGYLWAEKVISK